jgi:hypothetical protein
VGYLRGQFEPIVADLPLDERHKEFLRSRWLDQLEWLDAKATSARKAYFRLRLTTVVGAVMLPALVSANVANDDLDASVRVATWVVSLVVAVSAAIEQLVHFGATWRNYRQTAERLKAEGWLFFQLSGDYAADGATHESAYRSFAKRVEELIQTDVEVYLTEVAGEQEPKKPETPGRPP